MQNASQPINSGIGITAVKAASMCRKEPRREERLTQDQIDRILPYEDTACCTD